MKMEMEKIIEKWNEDAHIDGSELAIEQLKVSQLHNKYFKILVGERTILKEMEIKVAQLKRMLIDYYAQRLNNAIDLEKINREPWENKVLKSEQDIYINGDSEMIDLVLRVSIQEEKVNYLKAIIGRLEWRGGDIRNAIEWNKFSKGQ